MREIIIDLFAGGGGASEGIEQALGVPVDEAVNHNPEAIAMHEANHSRTRHYIEDVFVVNPYKVAAGRPVGLLWASPDCTHHSRAKGGKPVNKKIRGLAWVVVKWAKAVKPRVIMLENVPEFKEWGPLDKNDKPDKTKKGMTFNLWANQLRGLGYDVQFREISACDYGAPTIRKRLFMIARCDGQPIVWPEPTHAKPGSLFGLPAYRTAAECIDWSIPCPSIFLTTKQVKDQGLKCKRPLSDNTLRRIARGIQRYVIESDDPYIVKIGHTSANGGQVHKITEPLRTIVSKAEDCLIVPSLAQVGYGERKGQLPRSLDIKKPIGTLVSTGKNALVTAFLDKHYGGSLVGRPMDKPVATITSRGTQQSVVTAHIAKHYTGAVGSKIKKPLGTVTSIDHNSLVATHLTKFYSTNTGSDMRKPIPSVTATGQHIGEVRAFMIKYYGCGVGQGCKEPIHTVTSKDRIGLVTIAGQDYQITDIGMRMLSPRELARAQGFPDSYILTGTKTSQVAKIGNSVCPPIAKELVKANVKLTEIIKQQVG